MEIALCSAMWMDISDEGAVLFEQKKFKFTDIFCSIQNSFVHTIEIRVMPAIKIYKTSNVEF